MHASTYRAPTCNGTTETITADPFADLIAAIPPCVPECTGAAYGRNTCPAQTARYDLVTRGKIHADNLARAARREAQGKTIYARNLRASAAGIRRDSERDAARWAKEARCTALAA